MATTKIALTCQSDCGATLSAIAEAHGDGISQADTRGVISEWLAIHNHADIRTMIKQMEDEMKGDSTDADPSAGPGK